VLDIKATALSVTFPPLRMRALYLDRGYKSRLGPERVGKVDAEKMEKI
jgi:hypothetical protein